MFQRIVLDEAHLIKNPNSIRCEAVTEIGKHCIYRWCLTGTPIHNNLLDLFALCRFLKINQCSTKKHFCKLLNINHQGLLQPDTSQSRLILQSFLASFMMRRTKDEVLPNLPPKKYAIHETNFSNEERIVYEMFEEQARTELHKYLSDVTNGNNNNYISILATILRLRQVCNDSCLVTYSKHDNMDNKVASSKMYLLMKRLQYIHDKDPHSKILVFSQFTSFLDLCELSLKQNKLRFERYDGQLNYNQRKNALKIFSEDNNIQILLISLKCASLGLNLTMANRVIFCDSWWNPAIENQAIDRCHRIGQTKTVFVKKLTIKN